MHSVHVLNTESCRWSDANFNV